MSNNDSSPSNPRRDCEPLSRDSVGAELDRQHEQMAFQLDELLEIIERGEIPSPDRIADIDPQVVLAVRALNDACEHEDEELHVRTTEELIEPPSQSILAPNQKIDRYEIVDCLGSGGQAVTFRAFDPDLQRHVAIKLYHGLKMASDHETVLKEGRALARIQSPYVNRCYDAQQFGNYSYLVLELVRGETINHVQKRKNWGSREIANVLSLLCEGLAEVHARGLVHRDLKPDNILIDLDGKPRLVDFGLAMSLSNAGERSGKGTPSYMSPEQARGELEHIDSRTDVFGVGAVLYRLLTGRALYQGISSQEIVAKAMRAEFTPIQSLCPEIPEQLALICNKCLSADPQKRYRDVNELRNALDQWRTPKPQQPNRRFAIATTIVATVAIFAAVVASSVFRNPTKTPPETPQVVGSNPRSDFKIDAHIVGGTIKDSGEIVLYEGQTLRLQLTVDKPSYVVVWSVEGNQAISLFPNAAEPNGFISANQMQTIPGESQVEDVQPLSIEAVVSQHDEFLHVIASTKPIQAISDSDTQPDDMQRNTLRGLPSTGGNFKDFVRGLKLIRRHKADDILISEKIIRYRVVKKVDG
jgi:serine/threonine protein kinase